MPALAAQQTGQKPIVEIKGLTKQFPGTRALNNVSISFAPGEVHALVGENGAGKSTLIKILTGAYTRTAGEILIEGEPVDFSSPLDAQNHGIAVVHQEIAVCPHLTVAQNLFLGEEMCHLGIIRERDMVKRAQEIFDDLGFDISPRAVVSQLPVAQQQLLVIAKAVSKNARFIIFDEPTAFLSDKEAKQLFEIIRRLNGQGITILYVSHRLEEVFELCDRATVLRDGEVVGTRAIEELDTDKIVEMMVGREITDLFYKEDISIGPERLRVEGLRNDVIEDISFNLRQGEILGMFGLVGSGRSDVVRAIFGADELEAGKIFIDGKEVTINNPKTAINHGLAYVPENRRLQGLCMNLSVGQNSNMAMYEAITKMGLVRSDKERQLARQAIQSLNIRTTGPAQLVQSLSGGNQQKVSMAKWLNRESEIYFFDEPTTGVDVGAKTEIYRLMARIARNGGAIVMISSYLPEVMGLADRILVMRKGRIVGTFERETANEEEILRIALGQGKEV